MYTRPKNYIRKVKKFHIKTPYIKIKSCPYYFCSKTKEIKYKGHIGYYKEITDYRTCEYSVNRFFTLHTYNQLSKKYYLRRTYKKG